jgi:hypothetical protein
MDQNRLPTPPTTSTTWPQFDPEVMRDYGGKWVVTHAHQIVVAGDDPDEVRLQAASQLGVDANQLIVVAIPSLDSLF